MNKFDRIYDLYRILRDRRTPISLQALAERLECSQPTVKRTIHKIREEFGAPIETVRGRGYLLNKAGRDGMHELPGLWFNASELQALLTSHHMLSQVEPGILSEEIRPLKERIVAILQKRHAGRGQILHRIRIAGSSRRHVDKHRFRQVCDALVRRRRLQIAYHARGNDHTSQRVISPQRLTHYRDNWYLDAWCHSRHALRCFALERIRSIETLKQPARDTSQSELEQGSRSYGIFSGAGKHTAVIRFSTRRARWIAEEAWHLDQTGRWLDDGRWELTLPYEDPTELIMDLLRFGPDVEVVSPASLRRSLMEQLHRTLRIYEGEEDMDQKMIPPPAKTK